MISCSNLYQDLTSTTVELTPEFISHVRNTTTGDNNYIFAKLTCGRKTITKKIDISEQTAANGAVLTFDNLIVGKKGSVYIAVANDETVEDFKSEIIASIEGTTNFTVQPNGNTKIKVSLKENEENFFAQFLTFPYNENKLVDYIGLNFTEYSTITAPLPVGTTRWQIYFNYWSDISYHGSFGEEIDVKKELMNYKNYFNYPGEGKTTFVQLEATGEPANKINTPIVYCEKDSNEEEVSYTYKILGSNTLVLPTTSEIKDYCFDNAGNFYFIMDECAYKLAYDFDTNSYESAIIDGEFCNPFYSYPDISAQGITYDKAQNTLYLLTYEQTGGDTNLVKFSNPAGTIYKTSGYNESPESFSLPTEDAEPNSQSWTAHNGKIYVASVHQIADKYDNISYNLVLQEYEYVEDSSNNTWTRTSEEDYPINVNNTYPNFTTDIMFQDGSLYIIFSCSSKTWAGSDDEAINYNYSTGGILEYNIESNGFDESFGIKGFAPNNSKKITGNEEHNISFYAPTKGTESTSFYGPTKFVAIMPKKLVFLDQGASIDDYSFDTDTPQIIPTKSRIVEYDLSTNTFTSKEINGSNLDISFGFTM